MQSKIHIKGKYYPNKSGVYSLETLEGKILYIGSSKLLSNALSRHVYYLKRGLYASTNKSVLQQAYESNNLAFNIIKYCEPNDYELASIEQQHIKLNADSICNYEITVKRHSSNRDKLTAYRRRLNSRGANNPNAKYDEQVISEILWLKINTSMRPAEIAKHYDLSNMYISAIGTQKWIYTQPRIPEWYLKEHVITEASVMVINEIPKVSV